MKTREKWRKQRRVAVSITIKSILVFSAIAARASDFTNDWQHFGPAYDRYPQVLQAGSRTEILGPLFGWETSERANLFRFSPVFSLYRDSVVEQTEFEVLYPLLAFDKFGKEYRFHIMQVVSWSGGEALQGSDVKRTTIFPFYISQRSPDPAKNYTAVVPFYGHLKNRFFRDEAFFVMLPLYLETVKRGVTTYNYLFPFFHRREGPGLKGWQFWPLAGHEKKEVTAGTNHWGDRVVSGGHEKTMALWPFYFNNTLGTGTTNVQKQLVLLPFYTSQVSSSRVSKSYGFPLGYTHTIDRAAGYEEKDMPWPLVVFADGPGKTTRRVWPFYSRAKTPTAESAFYAWPIYKYNRIHAAPLDRERRRILLFLYSDIREKNTADGTALLRRDLWPLYTWRKDRAGQERMQALALLEPILPNSKSIERLYSPVYALWRAEKNARTGASSKSLLWNLYREEKRAGFKKQVALFGLFQRERSGDRTRWRIFFVPLSGGSGKEANEMAGEG